MSAAEKVKTTYAESLALELSSGVRHEFVDGFAHAMAGGEPEHARLALSIGAELRQLLRGGPCRVFSSDLKVHVPASGNAYYADVAAVCGPLARGAADPLAVTNPTMLVEVLSPSTELFDRGERFADYRLFASLQHYVMVTVGRRRIEHYRRNADGTWTLTVASAGEALALPEFSGRLAVDDVYEGDDPVG
jgi:Uma2 family endonuclease